MPQIQYITNYHNPHSLNAAPAPHFQWARHYIGYAACMAVSLLFIVLMPIIGIKICFVAELAT